MQYKASTINRMALPRSKRMRALGAASVTPAVVNGESGDKYWYGETDTETEETEVSTTYPVKISKRLRIVDESGASHGDISIDANGRFVFDKGIISKEDIIAYGVGGEDVKSVADVIEEYLAEHGVGGYEPPVGGIPKKDLASDVQTSLDKADTAIQSLAGYASENWVTKNYAPKSHYHGTLIDGGDDYHSAGLAYYGTERTSSNTTYLGAWFSRGDNTGFSIGKIGKDAIKAWLGLGARAYDSTSYLPLSGGHITGTCSIDKTKWLIMYNSDYSDGMPNYGIGWDNNAQGNHCLYLRNYFGISLWSNPTYGGPISVNSNLYVSGNVGIGISNPTCKLEVNGSIRSNGNIYGTGWIQALGSIYAGSKKGDGAIIYVDGVQKLSASTTYNNATYLYGDGMDFVSQQAVVTMMQLHVTQGISNNYIDRPFQLRKGAKFYNICIECDNEGANYSSRSSEINNYTSALSLQHNTSNNLVACNGGGNVGIGTNSPSYKLHVEGSVYSSGNLAVEGYSNIKGRIKTSASTSATGGGGIELGNCKLLQLNNSIMCFADEFRFAAKDAGWNWNQWAGLRYDYSNKKIYLGIADGTVFNKNGNALTGGTVQLVNCGLVASGDVTAYSDRRLKSDIKDLEFRGSLSPKTYIKDGKRCVGFIAQEVRELYPELVLGEETENEYLSLNYGAITAVLSAENKQLKQEVDELKSEVEGLKKMVKLLMKRR